MRITFIMPFASLAGGNRVIALYARKLVERGHDVWVISQPDTPMPSWKQWLYRALGKGHRIKRKKRTPLLDFLGERHVVLDRARAVENRDVPDGDAIFATWWRTAPVVAGLSPSKGAKFYLLQDYEMFDYLPVDEVAATYTLPLHKLAVSGYIADAVRTNHGVSTVDVIPNAVDLAQFSVPPRVKNGQLTVGFLYKVTQRKRVTLAIEAVTRAKEYIPELQVVAFGASAILPDAPMPDWITYRRAPAQDDIPGIYAQCDLWLFTSAHEGFGLPLLEAMACRTPVLATRAGAAPDLIDGSNGTLLEPTPEAFVAELRRFDQMSPAQWQEFSNAAHQTAHGYSWDDATDMLVAALTKHVKL